MLSQEDRICHGRTLPGGRRGAVWAGPYASLGDACVRPCVNTYYMQYNMQYYIQYYMLSYLCAEPSLCVWGGWAHRYTAVVRTDHGHATAMFPHIPWYMQYIR